MNTPTLNRHPGEGRDPAMAKGMRYAACPLKGETALPLAFFKTVNGAQRYAESLGDSADTCSIQNRKGLEVRRMQRGPYPYGWKRVRPNP